MGDPADMPNIVVRRRSSLFTNNSNSDPTASAAQCSIKSRYEKQLNDEIDSWNRLVRSKIQEINQHKNNNIELDVSLLSDEQRLYLKAGPDLNNFVQESNDLSDLIERYVRKKSFLAQRYEAILSEARATLDNKALDVVETELLSEKLV